MKKVGVGLAAAAALVVGGISVVGGSGEDVGVQEAQADALPVEQVAARVEEIRGLKFKRQPPVELIGQKELEGELKRVKREVAREVKGSAKQRANMLVAASELVVTMTGLVDLERDKEVLGRNIFEREGEVTVAGLYVPERGRIYVVKELAEQNPKEAEAVLAHELAHALEDQTFGGFERNPKPFADSAFARHALHEGSATLAEVMYRIEHQDARGPVERAIGGVKQQTTDPKAPPGLNVMSTFPYVEGAKFSANLHGEGGWQRVNRAHQDPPKTTAAVLHPQAWPEDRHERPRFTVADALGPDWGRLGRADVGEVDTLAILSAGLPTEEARRAAEGWEAGRFEAWVHKSIPKRCKPPCRSKAASVIVWRMKDDAQARELSDALKKSLAKAAGAKPAEGGLAFKGGAAAQLVRGRVAVLAFAPSAEEAKKLAQAAPRS